MFENRVGEKNVNKYGSKMTIISYINAHNITVRFDNGCKVESSYQCFKNGSIKSPYDKTIYNNGYLGEGIYKSNKDGKSTIQYEYWKHMLLRCYDEKSLKKFPTYIGCSVCEEWLNFQVFAKWFDENYYRIENDRMELDKDVLYKRNKIYSSETCIFVPRRINMLFVKCNSLRGEYPIGVSYHKNNKKFQSMCDILNEGKSKQKFLGYSNTPEEAFDKYKVFKENYIKQIADEYISKIPFKLYEAMYRYVVKITD